MEKHHVSTITDEPLHVMTFPSREDLIAILKTLEPSMVLLVGYIDKDGIVRGLRAEDLEK